MIVYYLGACKDQLMEFSNPIMSFIILQTWHNLSVNFIMLVCIIFHFSANGPNFKNGLVNVFCKRKIKRTKIKTKIVCVFSFSSVVCYKYFQLASSCHELPSVYLFKFFFFS